MPNRILWNFLLGLTDVFVMMMMYMNTTKYSRNRPQMNRILEFNFISSITRYMSNREVKKKEKNRWDVQVGKTNREHLINHPGVMIICSKFDCSKNLLDTILLLLDSVRAIIFFLVNCSNPVNLWGWTGFEQFHF